MSATGASLQLVLQSGGSATAERAPGAASVGVQ